MHRQWNDEAERDALWSFATERFTVAFFAELEDLDPADSFEFDDDITFAREDDPAHWFCAVVAVYDADGGLVGWNTLGGCSYTSFREFYTGHRDPDPANRNTLALRAQHKAICHYFPDMVRQAINQARCTILRRGKDAARIRQNLAPDPSAILADVMRKKGAVERDGAYHKPQS